MDGLPMDLRLEERRAEMFRLPARVVVPCCLTLERAWRWCVIATLRDQRVAGMKGREISWMNLRRLFERRWAEMCRLYEIAEDSEERAALMEAGRLALSNGMVAELKRKRGAAVRAA